MTQFSLRLQKKKRISTFTTSTENCTGSLSAIKQDRENKCIDCKEDIKLSLFANIWLSILKISNNSHKNAFITNKLV